MSSQETLQGITSTSFSRGFGRSFGCSWFMTHIVCNMLLLLCACLFSAIATAVLVDKVGGNYESVGNISSSLLHRAFVNFFEPTIRPVQAQNVTNELSAHIVFSANPVKIASVARVRHFVCVFHHRHSGRRANGRVFEATRFPHEFCDNILFCCASIGDAFQLLLEPPAVHALAAIAQLKRAAGRRLEVSLAIGGTAQDNAAFRKLADDVEGSRVNLVVNLASLLEPLGADAVFLHWAYPALEERDSLTLLAADMARSLLVEARLGLGVVVPADSRTSVGFDLLALSKVVPGHYLLVAPPQLRDEDYKRVSEPLSSPTISAYASIYETTAHYTLRGDFADGRDQLCYAVPMGGFSFELRNVPSAPGQLPLSTAVGPAEPGWRVGEKSGPVAYYEACRAGGNSSSVGRYSTRLVRGSRALSYVRPRGAARFVADLRRRLPVACLVLWDIENDDWPAVCRPGLPYGISRTLWKLRRGPRRWPMGSPQPPIASG